MPDTKTNLSPTDQAFLEAVTWNDQGLVPVIAQEADSGDVLMMAWMNRDALARTAASLTAAGPGSCVAIAEDLSTEAGCRRFADAFAARESSAWGLAGRA